MRTLSKSFFKSTDSDKTTNSNGVTRLIYASPEDLDQNKRDNPVNFGSGWINAPSQKPIRSIGISVGGQTNLGLLIRHLNTLGDPNFQKILPVYAGFGLYSSVEDDTIKTNQIMLRDTLKNRERKQKDRQYHERVYMSDADRLAFIDDCAQIVAGNIRHLLKSFDQAVFLTIGSSQTLALEFAASIMGNIENEIRLIDGLSTYDELGILHNHMDRPQKQNVYGLNASIYADTPSITPYYMTSFEKNSDHTQNKSHVLQVLEKKKDLIEDDAYMLLRGCVYTFINTKFNEAHDLVDYTIRRMVRSYDIDKKEILNIIFKISNSMQHVISDLESLIQQLQRIRSLYTDDELQTQVVDPIKQQIKHIIDTIRKDDFRTKYNQLIQYVSSRKQSKDESKLKYNPRQRKAWSIYFDRIVSRFFDSTTLHIRDPYGTDSIPRHATTRNDKLDTFMKAKQRNVIGTPNSKAVQIGFNDLPPTQLASDASIKKHLERVESLSKKTLFVIVDDDIRSDVSMQHAYHEFVKNNQIILSDTNYTIATCIYTNMTRGRETSAYDTRGRNSDIGTYAVKEEKIKHDKIFNKSQKQKLPESFSSKFKRLTIITEHNQG